MASGHRWCPKFEARHFHYPQWNVPCRGLPFLVGCQCKSAYLLSRKIGPMPTHFRFFVGQCPRIELASIAHIHERVFTTSTGATESSFCTTALKLFASNIRNGMPPIIAMCHTCSTKIPRHARQAGQVHTGQARHAQASRPAGQAHTKDKRDAHTWPWSRKARGHRARKAKNQRGEGSEPERKTTKEPHKTSRTSGTS